MNLIDLKHFGIDQAFPYKKDTITILEGNGLPLWQVTILKTLPPLQVRHFARWHGLMPRISIWR